MIWVHEWSRAAVLLRNDTLMRLDQNTTVTFIAPETERTFILHLFLGAIHFFSRVPQGLKVITPFVDAAIEGTEFFARVGHEQTFLSILTGRVVASNALGSVALMSGQTAEAAEGQAPVPRVVVRPRDAVQWALYYPLILEYFPDNFMGESAWQVTLRRSIHLYQEGDLPMAFATMMGLHERRPGTTFFHLSRCLPAHRRARCGGTADIDRALALEPHHSPAFALRALIAVVHNNKDSALDLAQQAVELRPESATARVALSLCSTGPF